MTAHEFNPLTYLEPVTLSFIRQACGDRDDLKRYAWRDTGGPVPTLQELAEMADKVAALAHGSPVFGAGFIAPTLRAMAEGKRWAVVNYGLPGHPDCRTVLTAATP